MASFPRIAWLVFIPFAAATNLSFSGGFDRKECFARTVALMSNGSLNLDDDVFFRDDTGRPLSSQNNLTLTLQGCKRLCGPDQAWYFDIGPRLSVWLIPILVLLSNVELSPLDKRRFLAILHLLGDPIDSIWSLVHKIDSWDRCYRLAEPFGNSCGKCQRVVAMVFAGFEEIEGPRIKTSAYFQALTKQRCLHQQFHEWRRTAVKLAESRTDEFFRTCLAILLYIFQLVAGFVTELGGGNSSPPGGRIATGVFLSWLIPLVMISNVAGGFPSRRTCHDILMDFAERTGKPLLLPHTQSVLLPGVPSVTRSGLTKHFDSLGWMGAIHTYRPWKTKYVSLDGRRRHTVLAFLVAMSSVCVSFTGAFIILWYSLPTGLNCRHGWLVGIFLLWIVSDLLTWLSYVAKWATGKYHWRLVLAKDALIAIPSITIMFLSACGLFNSCYCWSGFLYYRNNAHVLLNSDPFYNLNDRTVYPIVVGTCIALQFAIFTLMAVSWRRGLKVLRWGEKARREEWERVVGYAKCECGEPGVLHRQHFAGAASGSGDHLLKTGDTELQVLEIRLDKS